MGREVRMVPPGWEHPRDKSGNLKPLLKQTEAEYDSEAAAWERRDLSGLPSCVETDFDDYENYEDFAGSRSPESRMPDFPAGTATHYMMYETESDGTPISPAFATPEELAHWLADNKASACGTRRATYEQWLATIKQGPACSMVYSPRSGFVSGVEYESPLSRSLK